ncbi:LytTR family DNA-binding domain-containing protein [Planktotalea sp.]|uniref:LytTR family DNA-binding domain-containing protein n=1 Tax=Planktotalea sp. TaxID=2029877 RepID=UPI0032976BF7
MSNAQIEAHPLLGKLQSIFYNTALRVFNKHTLIITAASIILTAFSGPFGTYDQYSFGRGLVVWGVLISSGVLTAFFTCEACSAIFEKHSDFNKQMIFLGIGSIAISVVINFLLTHWVDRPADVRPSIGWLWMMVMSIMAIVVSVRNMLPEFAFFTRQVSANESLDETRFQLPQHSRLAQRLNIPRDEQVVHVSANGHFVEVFTPVNTYRLRMRFSDAVAELDDTVGLTVHRSHWVHRSALRGWVPNAAKPFVVLETDAQVPVSKTHFDKVQALGLEEVSLEKAL